MNGAEEKMKYREVFLRDRQIIKTKLLTRKS